MRDAITDLTAVEDTLELNSCNTISDSRKTPIECQLSFTNPNRANSIPNDDEVSKKLNNDSSGQVYLVFVSMYPCNSGRIWFCNFYQKISKYEDLSPEVMIFG